MEHQQCIFPYLQAIQGRNANMLYGSIGATNMSINQSTGAVICYNYGVNSGDQYTPPYGISFGYICIAVK